MRFLNRKAVTTLVAVGLLAVLALAAGCSRNQEAGKGGTQPGVAGTGQAASSANEGMSTAAHEGMSAAEHEKMMQSPEHQKMMQSASHEGMSAAEHEKMMQSADHGQAAGGKEGAESQGGGHGGGHGGHEKQTPIEDIKDVPPLTTESPVRIAFPGVKIEPRVIRLKAGEITFLVTNDDTEGGRSHNLRIARWKEGVRPARGEVIEPGPWMGPSGKREFTVRLDPGTYYVYCAQADHEESGMTGKIIVEP